MHKPDPPAEPSDTDGRLRTYYATIPQFIQVADHVYVERQVIDLFVTSMELSWYVWHWLLTDRVTNMDNKDIGHQLRLFIQHMHKEGQGCPIRLSYRIQDDG